MTTTEKTYYAISSAGYGQAHTIAEAVTNHLCALMDAQPSWASDSYEWREHVRGIRPTIFIAPPRATGFVITADRVVWTHEGGAVLRPVDEVDVVGP